LGFLKDYYLRYWKPFWLAIACLTAEAFCDLMQPTIMSRIIDVGVAAQNLRYVVEAGGLMLAVTAVGAAAALGRNYLAGTVSQKFGRDLRSDLFRQIQRFSFENIDRFETASLITRLTNDLTQLQNFVNGIMRIFVKAPLVCIGSIIMAILLNPALAGILAVVVPVIGLIIFVSMRSGYPFFRKVQTSMDRMNGVTREYLSGVRVVKAFNRFDYEGGRFGAANRQLAEVSTNAMRVMAGFAPGITLAVNLGIVAVLWLGGYWVNYGTTHVGQIIAFINYMTQILQALIMISFIFIVFVRARASGERIGEVLAVSGSMPEASAPVTPVAANRGKVEFREVDFAYPAASKERVLTGINLVCRPGETVGIIGSTGSGKSSLVNLIPRFYDAGSGEVLVHGVNVKESDLKQLRQTIALVPQKTLLFTGTILTNIRWGNETATREEVEAAARIAQAHDFIAGFPERYDTMLGQGGVNLSGGQKQRIAIARALVGNPDILILDDCTSAVDGMTEARIKAALRSLRSGLTTLLITQRITSVMDADRILVLDNGAIAGWGTHRELMESCGVYRDIFRSQIGKEEEYNGAG
jgi:ATP-binding cassette subfamily B multidrug efflux pump